MGLACRKCNGEKLRIATNTGYRYVCYCEEWKVQLRMLEAARKREIAIERRRGR
jgi:hypothetical protein